MFFGSQLNRVSVHSLSVFNMIDPFSIEYSDKDLDLFTDAELCNLAPGSILVFDCESYKNYFLISFKCPTTKKIVYFEDDGEDLTINIAKLDYLLQKCCIVGFNSYNYDMVVLTAAMMGARAATIKRIGNKVIYEAMHRKDVEAELSLEFQIPNFKIPALNHIDLIEVAPLQASLKLYSGRLHTSRMQEVNIDPEKELSELEKNVVKHYNINDLDNTILLLQELKPALELRIQLSKEYNQDLRSRSDAQIAESIIGSELKKLNGFWPKRGKIEPGTCYKYEVPKFMQFETDKMKDVLKLIANTYIKIDAFGYLEMPKEINGLSVDIGQCTYKIGVGGLHSTEQSVSHKADENILLIDKDVASYYPSIILNLELYPQHLGKNFLKVYRSIVQRRLEAKHTKNKIVDQSLKITINGTFGKFGNKYSIMYNPQGIIQILMTGQLSLLLLIETLELAGIPVVSANTDGVLIKCPKEMYNRMEAAVIYWQKLTGFETEETRYKATYNRDVNNYIAVKEDNTVKVKGAYAERGSSGNSILSKNPENLIVSDAVVKFLVENVPINETISNCRDIKRFVTVRTVKGGAEKSGVFLGKTVRWYYSTKVQGIINYVKTGNKVPNTENAMPLMNLPEQFPDDIDYERYVKVAEDVLNDIGYYNKGKQSTGRLF